MKIVIKQISILAMVLITSCSTGKKLDTNDTDKAYISLSKGRCLGNCPVYDLWVFKDGKVLFKGIDNVEKIGFHETVVSTETIKKIERLLKAADTENIEAPKGRDLPLSILRYNGKKVAFQESRIKGSLLILNNLLKNLKNKI